MSAERTSSYWCELAWLGGERAEAGVLVELDGERIASVDGRRRARRRRRATRRADVPGLANAHSHAFQRALRGRTQERARARSGPGASGCTSSPSGSTPTATSPWPGPRFAEMALAGITAVGEFHYLHHGPAALPTRTRTRLGAGRDRGRARGGIRITLLDTCYLHGGIGGARRAEQLRFSDGNAEAWAERVEAISEGPDGPGRRGDPQRPRGRPRVGGPSSPAGRPSASRPLHAHVSEQPAENEDCAARATARPRPRSSPTPARSTDRFTAVHATHLSDARRRAARRRRRLRAASARRPSATSPTGSAPARRLLDAGVRARARHRLPRVDRPVRGGAGGRARRAPGEPAGAGCHSAAELLARRDRGRLRQHRLAEAGRIAPGMRSPTSSPSASTGRASPGPLADHALESLVFAAAAADVRHVIVGGRVVVRDGAHVALDVGRRARRARSPGCTADELAGDRQHRPAGHQRPGARRGPAGHRPRRGARLRGTAGSPPSSAAGAAADERLRRRRPLRDPRLRRQPHPPRLRRRPGRGVRRADGGQAVRGGRHQRDHRGDAGGRATTSCGRWPRARRAEALPGRDHPHRDQVRLRPRRRERARGSARSPPS